MDNDYLRLLAISLDNFKNIEHGRVNFEDEKYIKKQIFDYDKSSVMGIYGQNGSGKTGVVESLLILKDLSKGKLSSDAHEKVTYGKDKSNLKYEFVYHSKEYTTLITYDVCFSIFANGPQLVSERVTFKPLIDGLWQKETTFIDVNFKGGSIKPKNRIKCIVNKNIEVFNKAILNGQTSNESLVFNDNVIESIILSDKDVISEEAKIIKLLKYNLNINLIIISGYNFGSMYLDSYLMQSLDHSNIKPTNIKIDLFSKNEFIKEDYEIVKKQIAKNNLSLSEIIPGLSIISEEKELSHNGTTLYEVEFYSLREDKKVPLRNESQGIKRLISIIGALICAYNNMNVLLAVDEFDAGVFEYLLGDLLEIFDNSGQGQLIFTSHNLRILEILTKESIVFTTNDPLNRYTRMKNVKGNNNLRDLYLRTIFLGQGNLYQATDQYSIAKSLRRAGSKDEK